MPYNMENMTTNIKHTSHIALLACFLALVFTAQSVSAQTELITNGGFEQVLIATDGQTLLQAPTLPAQFTPVPGINFCVKI